MEVGRYIPTAATRRSNPDASVFAKLDALSSFTSFSHKFAQQENRTIRDSLLKWYDTPKKGRKPHVADSVERHGSWEDATKHQCQCRTLAKRANNPSTQQRPDEDAAIPAQK